MTRRLSRRAFIGGAAAATAAVAGASTWAVLATRDADSRPRAARSAVASPGPSPSPPATLPPPPPGGRQVITAPSSLDLDTFDAQLTGKSAVVEILGRTHSRLVQWVQGAQTWEVQPDLAASWETPDPATYIFQLDPEARWQPRPPLNGRAVTADDVVTHFRRSLAIAAGGKAPLAQRYHQYASIASVDSPSPGQVRFRLNNPDRFLLDTLAGEFALIQAPEAVATFEQTWKRLDSDHVVGSGPWTFDWSDDGAKFTAARGGHREAVLDELYLTEPYDNSRRFLNGALDEAITFDRRDAAAVNAHDPGAFDQYRRPAREILMSTFFIGAPPWNNLDLVTAISAAMARSELSETLFGGRAEPVHGIPRALGGGETNSPSQVVPGDSPGADGRYSDALARWQAAGGPGLGTVRVDFPSVFDPLYSASSIVIDQLNRVLGPQFLPAVESYTTISKRVLAGEYGKGRAAFWFGWGPPLTTPCAARYFAEFYAPGSPGQLTVGGPRTTMGAQEVSRLAGLGYLGIVPWVHQHNEVYRLHSRSGPVPSPLWQQHRDWERRNLA